MRTTTKTDPKRDASIALGLLKQRFGTIRKASEIMLGQDAALQSSRDKLADTLNKMRRLLAVDEKQGSRDQEPGEKSPAEIALSKILDLVAASDLPDEIKAQINELASNPGAAEDDEVLGRNDATFEARRSFEPRFDPAQDARLASRLASDACLGAAVASANTRSPVAEKLRQHMNRIKWL